MTEGTAIDWDEARRRLATLDKSIEEALEPSAEQASRMLDERARSLARALPTLEDTGPGIEAVVFSIGEQRLALETRYAREIIRCPDMTPVPGGGSLLAGITNLRGELLPIFDLRDLLGTSHVDVVAFEWAIVCGEENAEFGLLSEAGIELTQLVPEEMLATTADIERLPSGSVKGVTRSGVTILDASVLFAHQVFFPQQIQRESRSSGLET